jgi:ATP-dependent Clp protease ATP-binding subunit ClpA
MLSETTTALNDRTRTWTKTSTLDEEPSVKETIEILYGLRDRYEQHHKLTISDLALEAAAQLSDRYISDRYLPDKAIDLMDEADSRVRILNSKAPSAAKSLNKKLRQVLKDKEDAIAVQEFSKAGELHLRELEIQTEIRELIPDNNSHSTDADSSPVVNEELKAYFRPEFLNRLDEIIVFRQLTTDEVKQISSILLGEVCSRLTEQGITLEVTERFKDRLVEEGYDPSYGARPLRRAIASLLEDCLAEEILCGSLKGGDTVVVDVDDEGKIQVLQSNKWKLLPPAALA